MYPELKRPFEFRIVEALGAYCKDLARVHIGGNIVKMAQTLPSNIFGSNYDIFIVKFPQFEGPLKSFIEKDLDTQRKLLGYTLSGCQFRDEVLTPVDLDSEEKIQNYRETIFPRLNNRKQELGLCKVWTKEEIGFLIDVGYSDMPITPSNIIKQYQDLYGKKYRVESSIRAKIKDLKKAKKMPGFNTNWNLVGEDALYLRALARGENRKAYLEDIVTELQTKFPLEPITKRRLEIFFEAENKIQYEQVAA